MVISETSKRSASSCELTTPCSLSRVWICARRSTVVSDFIEEEEEDDEDMRRLHCRVWVLMLRLHVYGVNIFVEFCGLCKVML